VSCNNSNRDCNEIKVKKNSEGRKFQLKLWLKQVEKKHEAFKVFSKNQYPFATAVASEEDEKKAYAIRAHPEGGEKNRICNGACRWDISWECPTGRLCADHYQ